jgi:hypothetical protein
MPNDRTLHERENDQQRTTKQQNDQPALIFELLAQFKGTDKGLTTGIPPGYRAIKFEAADPANSSRTSTPTPPSNVKAPQQLGAVRGSTAG